MFKTATFMTFIVVGIFRSSLGTTAPTSHHYYKNTISAIAKNLRNLAYVRDFVPGDQSESVIHHRYGLEIEKREVGNADLPSRYDDELKEKSISFYAEATVANSDIKDRPRMREQLKTAMKWHWNSYEEFEDYADKIFFQVKDRHENEV